MDLHKDYLKVMEKVDLWECAIANVPRHQHNAASKWLGIERTLLSSMSRAARERIDQLTPPDCPDEYGEALAYKVMLAIMQGWGPLRHHSAALTSTPQPSDSSCQVVVANTTTQTTPDTETPVAIKEEKVWLLRKKCELLKKRKWSSCENC